MRIDLHVHHTHGMTDANDLLSRLNAAGFDGCAVMSESPLPFLEPTGVLNPEQRLKNVMEFTKGHDTLFPFFFINPTDQDAIEQVDMAVEAGIAGFKIICASHMPNDPRAVPTYLKIASVNKPILFHSGILYDGKNASGNYNRPCGFEVLLKIPKLRFALAHISWPWTDECISVYGKFCNYLECFSHENAAEMFVDTTPGTPRLYRRDALTKLLEQHPSVAKHIIWGSDCRTGNYNTEGVLSTRNRDECIYRELGYGQDFLDDLYGNNFFRFLNGPEA